MQNKKRSNRLTSSIISNDAECKCDSLIELEQRKMEMLLEMQQKINASPALNGGFDKLMFKVEGIEHSQSQLTQKVDSIHNAIYHQDEGLFARLNGVAITQYRENADIKTKFSIIENQNTITEQTLNSNIALVKQVDTSIEDHQRKIDDLTKWQKIASGALKWGGAAIGGGTVSIAFKLLYDWLTVHYK